MRQALEPEEVQALAQEHQVYFIGWMIRHGYPDALHPTIGHLAEFLIEHREPFRIEHTGTSPGHITIWTGYDERRGWYARVRGNEILLGLWVDVRFWLEHRWGQQGGMDPAQEVNPS